MGADLYMNKSFSKNEEKYKPQLDKKIEERNALPKGSDEANKIQEEVGELFNKLYSKEVYFRDSYNDSSLLWALGLSWWEDVMHLTDDEGNMTPDKAQEFIDVLEGCEIDTKAFASSAKESGLSDAECKEYLQKKYSELLVFLNSSIKNKENIYCSL